MTPYSASPSLTLETANIAILFCPILCHAVMNKICLNQVPVICKVTAHTSTLGYYYIYIQMCNEWRVKLFWGLSSPKYRRLGWLLMSPWLSVQSPIIQRSLSWHLNMYPNEINGSCVLGWSAGLFDHQTSKNPSSLSLSRSPSKNSLAASTLQHRDTYMYLD